MWNSYVFALFKIKCHGSKVMMNILDYMTSKRPNVLCGEITSD